MAENLDELLWYLHRGAESESRMRGLEDQAAIAQNLRTPTETVDVELGGGSYAGVLADLVNASRGRQMQRRITPELEQTRRNIGLAKAMSRNYDLRREAEETAYDREQDALSREDKMAQRNIGQYVNPETKQVENVRIDSRGVAYSDDGAPIENFSQWRKYETPKASRRGGSGGAFKPSGSERNEYKDSVRMQNLIGSMDDLWGSLTPEVREELNQPKMQAVLSVMPSSLARMGEEQIYKNPETRDYLIANNKLESELSKLMSGLAVTGFEMKDRQKWSPNAPGISDPERQRRLANIDRELSARIEGYEKLYPDYTFEAISSAKPTAEPMTNKPEFTGLTPEEEAELQALEAKYGPGE